MRRMMGCTAPSYLLLFLIGSSFLANVLAHSHTKDKIKDVKGNKNDHEDHHKDDKGDGDHKGDHHGDGEHRRDDEDDKKLKEKTHKEFLDLLKKFKEELLEKCKKDDSEKDRNNSHRDRDNGKKDDKDADKRGNDQESGKHIHHHHHFHPDGSISKNNKDGSEHHDPERDERNKYAGNHHHDHPDDYDRPDHHDREHGHDRAGSRDTHSYDENPRGHRRWNGRSDSGPYDHGRSRGRHVNPHYEVRDDGDDGKYHRSPDTHYRDSYSHGKYPNEHYGRRTEPRNSRYDDDSHSNHEEHHHHDLGRGAAHAGPNRNQHNFGPDTHRADESQYDSHGLPYITEVTYALPDKSQHAWVANKEPSTYQQPKTSPSIAHVCHHHDHIVRVEDQPNSQNQQPPVETRNPCAGPPVYKPAPSFPMDITAVLSIPSPYDSPCIEKPQPQPICHEPKQPQPTCVKPKEESPVYMVCVHKKLEAPCEPPRADPPHFPPPEPACPPPRRDPCSNSYVQQPQPHNNYRSNPC